MNLLKRHLGTLVLGLSCLLAAFGLGLEYRLLQRKLTGTLQPPVTSVEAAQMPELPQETIAELPPLGEFSAFVEQPLFIEGRQPLPEETEAASSEPGAEKKPPPAIRLTGIIDTPEAGQIILVQDQSNKTLRFKPGEAIDGWRVAELADDHVTLERDGETHVLELIKPRPAQPLPPAAPPRPAAQPPTQATQDNPFARAARKTTTKTIEE